MRFIPALLCALLLAPLAHAADYPSRTITLIVPLPPGTSGDVIARVYADRLAANLRVPVVVLNRDGMGGTVAAQALMEAKPDGYTLLCVTLPMLWPNTHYDPQALRLVSLLARYDLFAVTGAGSPLHSLAGLLVAGQSEDTAFSAPHVYGELAGLQLQELAGFRARDLYLGKGGEGQAQLDLLQGRVTYTFFYGPTAAAAVSSGVRALAVTSGRRSGFLPSVPTLGEHVSGWQPLEAGLGLAAPPGTPTEAVNRISQEIAVIAKEPATLERLKLLWSEAVSSTPEEFLHYRQSILPLYEHYGARLKRR